MAFLALSDQGCESFLIRELNRAFPHAKHRRQGPGLVTCDGILQAEAPPIFVFARQLLPDAQFIQAESISSWAHTLLEAIESFPEQRPWMLHLVPHYGVGQAGQNRCRLIRATLHDVLRKKRRYLLKALQDEPAPFSPDHSLVQLLLAAPDQGWLSSAPAPVPFQLRRGVWPFPGGEVPVAIDKAAPSRAFAKLLEAELRLGRRIAKGETCVDLGASPGSWSYVALLRGAIVTAIDRAPLRADLMRHRQLEFHKGDAFTFEPRTPADWLLCDVVATPERNVDLLLRWVRRRYARHFVVTLKFKGTEDYPILEHVKHALPPLCDEFYLTRLCANKNEVCAFGAVSTARAGAL